MIMIITEKALSGASTPISMVAESPGLESCSIDGERARGCRMNQEAQAATARHPTTRLAMILADLYRDSAPASQGGAEGRDPSPVPMDDAGGGRDTAASGTAESGRDISIGEILDRTRHAGFGFVAALLALVSIPLVGLTVPFGLAVAALGVQMVAGLSRPWLPGFIRRRRIAAATLETLSRRTTAWTGKMARVIRPRLPWLTVGPLWTLCGVGFVIQGLSLTLPIPGADWLFVVPIVLYGVGLLECDGLLILVCHIITLLQLVLAVVLWELIACGFADAYRWCVSVIG
jgi:hypothetical protein